MSWFSEVAKPHPIEKAVNMHQAAITHYEREYLRPHIQSAITSCRESVSYEEKLTVFRPSMSLNLAHNIAKAVKSKFSDCSERRSLAHLPMYESRYPKTIHMVSPNRQLNSSLSHQMSHLHKVAEVTPNRDQRRRHNRGIHGAEEETEAEAFTPRYQPKTAGA